MQNKDYLFPIERREMVKSVKKTCKTNDQHPPKKIRMTQSVLAKTVEPSAKRSQLWHFLNDTQESEATQPIDSKNITDPATNATHNVTPSMPANTLQSIEVNHFLPTVQTLYRRNTQLLRYSSDIEVTTGNFRFSNGILYKDESPIMNANIDIIESVYADDGSYYVCDVTVKNRTFCKKVPTASFLDGKWLAKFPGFAFFCGKSEGQTALHEYLNTLVLISDDSLWMEVPHSGWLQTGKRWVYVTPDGVIGQPDLAIRAKHGQHFSLFTPQIENLRQFLHMRNITPRSPVASIILLYTVQSFLYRLFKQADFLPKFILFIHGPRGSFKTSLSLSMTQIEHRQAPEFTLKSTSSGLEAGFREYNDAVMLIDDLAPVQSTSERTRLHSNLELIVRAFGDGTGKKRNYDFQPDGAKIEQYKAAGGAVLTGEYVTGLESSLARCLFLPITASDVDTELLATVRENDTILQRFLKYFLPYISNYFDEITEYIRQKGKEYRKINTNYANPRYSEYYAQLRVSFEILLTFGLKTLQLSKEDANVLSSEFQQQILRVLADNDRRLMDAAPTTQLCRAIITSIQQGQYQLQSVEIPAMRGAKIVLQDEENLYIKQQFLVDIKQSYDAANGLETPKYSSTALAQQLANAGIIASFSEGKNIRYGKKLPKQGSSRYMAVNKQKLSKYANM